MAGHRDIRCFRSGRSHHPLLHLQVPDSSNEEGDRGASRSAAGGEEVRQHAGDGSSSERADRDPGLLFPDGLRAGPNSERRSAVSGGGGAAKAEEQEEVTTVAGKVDGEKKSKEGKKEGRGAGKEGKGEEKEAAGKKKGEKGEKAAASGEGKGRKPAEKGGAKKAAK
ncbi:transmembrane inner ear expressed protein isoform X2 [Synchiropus splendidus]|uniref:transmembrane inner ear expressed protein isoform X2 n=1 Tax=Synchiropus splendidus TaxID=270530 RepID=UPI00237DA01A|nr:transmembrane inner ear expressed protein isoform X2 [Synchiropus splendidus]XP_053738310.1 transmembrane inner ear expressed protein isoform X2 [Synchiropus splendidus]